jgi:anti-anti-sigma factor
MHLVEQRGDAVIIHVKDDLDLTSAPILASTIELAEVCSGTRIIIAMENCRFCDAAGLSVLAVAHKRNGLHFFVVLPEEAPCRRTFTATGFATLLQLVPTLQRALDVQIGAV